MARAPMQVQSEKHQWWQASAVSWIGLVISFGAMLYSAGSLGERVNSQGAELNTLRAEIRATGATSVQILERLASIDTRLSLMLPKRRKPED
jgi:ATP-dependent protease ClpP protease subunit